jgi:hypothetical protein
MFCLGNMKDTANTNQHYVPQMLLRGFAIDGEKEQVRVFDKSTGKEFPTAIRNIGAERGYYDIDGSAAIDAAMNQMDDVSSPIIQKLRERRSISCLNTTDRIVLADASDEGIPGAHASHGRGYE